MKLTEHYAFRPLQAPTLIERAGKPSVIRVSGVFQNFLEKNQNGRVYPKKIWERLFAENSDFSKRIRERGMLGMIEHPEDGMTRLGETSHVITEARFATPMEIAGSNGKLVEGDIVGTYEVLEATPQGKVLGALIEAGVKFGVSSRGNGTVTERADGISEVNEDYECETWDVVFSPSVSRAIPSLVSEASQGGSKLSEMIASGRASQWESLTEKGSGAPKAKVVGGDGEGQGSKDDTGSSLTPKKKSITAENWMVRCNERIIYRGDSSTEAKEVFNEWKTTGSTTLWHNGQLIDESGIAPQPQQSDTTPMNKLAEIRSKQAEAIRLTQTEHKKLRPSDKSALFDSADQLRRDVAALRAVDPAIAPIAEDIELRLKKFITEMDEMPDDAPPVDDAPPIDDAPPVDDMGSGISPEDSATISDAAAKLRELCADDPECEDLASSLEAIVDGGEGDAPVPDIGEPVPEDDMAYDDMPVESRRLVKRVFQENRRLRAIYKKLSTTSASLLEAHRRLKSSLSERSGEGRGQIHESEAMEAARELASMYNTDMMSLGTRYMKVTNPGLYEAIKDDLKKARSWKAFSKVVEDYRNRHGHAGKPPARTLGESRNRPKAEGKRPVSNPPKTPTPPKPTVTESVHPAVLMRRNASRRG